MSADAERGRMLEVQLRGRGIHDEQVLEAMAVIPRHGFVLESSLDHAYADHPLSIGFGATISQPYIVRARPARSIGLRRRRRHR